MTCSSLGGIWGDMGGYGGSCCRRGKNLGGSPLLRYNKTIYILLYTTIYYYYYILLYTTIYNYIISSSALSKD